jgi:hypothetical protein
VFVSTDRDQLRLQLSVPIGEFFGREGYYFNGDVVIELEGTQSLDDPRFRRVMINGQQVPTDFLDWKYRFRQLREYLAEQGNAYEIGTIEIRDSKVVVRSHAD